MLKNNIDQYEFSSTFCSKIYNLKDSVNKTFNKKNGDDSKRRVEMDDTRCKPFPNLVIKLVQFLALGQSNTHNPKIVARGGRTISKLHSGFWVNFTISKENCQEYVTIAQWEA